MPLLVFGLHLALVQAPPVGLIAVHVGVGLGNRKDSPACDISTVEQIKSGLLGADLCVFNRVKSGEAVAGVPQRLGMAEALRPKIIRTAPNGIFEGVLQGKCNDMVAGTVPLIATTPGVKLLGPLPGELPSTPHGSQGVWRLCRPERRRKSQPCADPPPLDRCAAARGLPAWRWRCWL